MVKSKYWTQEEEDVLRELWGKVIIEEILKVFPTRTRGALEHKAVRLKLDSSKLNKSEIDFEYLRKLREVIEG